MKRLILTLIALAFFWPLSTRAAALKADYPRLANYFLKWEISNQEASELAKWDLLVLDMETQENSREQIQKIRELNPKIVLLAYLTTQEIMDNPADYNKDFLRRELYSRIIDGWWAKEASGKKISNWPGTSMLNLSDGAALDQEGKRFNDYLPEFIAKRLQATGLWDGVFLDNVWGDVAWVTGGTNLDLNNDGQAEAPAESNQLWVSGFKKMLDQTRSLTGNDFILVGNGRVYDGYQPILNGMMLENFPSPWENGGTWSGSMATIWRLPTLNRQPNFSIVNAYDKVQENYRKMRFAFTSALLGEGFFSFDYDVTSHGQIWWYDEYDVNLGPAQSGAYNLLADKGTTPGAGLWRRDFKRGLVLVNSTDQEQSYLFPKEDLQRINGTQDAAVNNGQRVNYLKLAPRDGIILLKRNTSVKNNPFTNGYFYRVFDQGGQQVQSGFFSYLSAFPGEAEMIVTDDDDSEISLIASAGSVSLNQNGRGLFKFRPYGANFKAGINLTARVADGYIRQIVTGPKTGGPQIRIFTPSGQLKGDFFAYDKQSRGGVSIALGDIDADGKDEIIAGPGAGLEPVVKIFSLQGKLETSFSAYDKKFRGGVSVALGDVDADGQLEIITGPGKGGGPQVRIFDSAGQAEKSFFAFDPSFHGGIRVSSSDLNGDNRDEILVGLKNFY